MEETDLLKNTRNAIKWRAVQEKNLDDAHPGVENEIIQTTEPEPKPDAVEPEPKPDAVEPDNLCGNRGSRCHLKRAMFLGLLVGRHISQRN